jgi:hypothetical protein
VALEPAGAEVARQLAEEDRIMAVLAGRDAIFLGQAGAADGDAGGDAVGDGLDFERFDGCHAAPVSGVGSADEAIKTD